MQTFLPLPNFRASAEALDYRRLGKQRVEAFQLLRAINDSWASNGQPSRGWRNHPAAVMWHGHGEALRLYMNIMIEEWVRRGYKNTMKLATVSNKVQMPCWFGNEQFHASHRANLLRKDSVFYGKFGWMEDPNLPYVWPK